MANFIFLPPPPFVPQTSQNSCWAASLEMWFKAETGFIRWTQQQLRYSAGDFAVGRGGINLSGLQDIISDSTAVGANKMFVKLVNTPADVPGIADVLNEVGYVYIAFTRPDGAGGHVNVLSGYDAKSSYYATDPDPAVIRTLRSHQFYFSKFPALVAWRLTSSMIGLDYSGRPPWEY
jgi:hypothetical protein